MGSISFSRLSIMSAVLILLITAGCSSTQVATGQNAQKNKQYRVQNAHSHNDYEQPHFFSAAYQAGFGSMEADIFLVDGDLLVAHNKRDISQQRSLAAMYLSPLAAMVKVNKGYPYKNHKAQLELLIDLKDPKDSPAYKKAVALTLSYKALANSKNLRITFTGNIPSDSVMGCSKRTNLF